MTQFKIIEKRNLWFIISFGIIITGFSLMAIRAINHQPALNYGIDFVGGQTIMLKSEKLSAMQAGNTNKTDIEDININFTQKVRESLDSLNIKGSVIQISKSNEIIIKTTGSNVANSQDIINAVKEKLGEVEILEIDLIGPSVGAELRGKSTLIFVTVCLAILGYVTVRFKYQYGVGAIVALVHDALVTISIASILGIEIDSGFVGAMLTILGYSINDTIVIFDRIRENISLQKNPQSVETTLNVAINQTFGRTINTSATAIIMVASLLIFGGSTIHDFCLTLFIGIVAGTYSSIFIASPILAMFPTFNKEKEISKA